MRSARRRRLDRRRVALLLWTKAMAMPERIRTRTSEAVPRSAARVPAKILTARPREPGRRDAVGLKPPTPWLRIPLSLLGVFRRGSTCRSLWRCFWPPLLRMRTLVPAAGTQLTSLVRDELEQAAVRVAEVDACPLTTCTATRYRAELDLYSARAEVVESVVDWPGPDEAQITSAGCTGSLASGTGVETGTMDVQLLVTKAAMGDAVRVADQFCANDIPVEGIRAHPASLRTNTARQTHRSTALPQSPRKASINRGYAGPTPADLAPHARRAAGHVVWLSPIPVNDGT